MEIGNIQLELISKARKYLRQSLDENINVHSSGICYFCSFALTPGYAKLKLWEKGFKNILNIFKIFCKDIISISNLHNYYLVNDSEINNKYTKIIVSWAEKKDFLSNGSYFDKYFKINSKDINESLWFLIYLDETLPEKINNNILIFTKSKKKFKYNLFYLVQNILKNIISSKFSLKKLFHKISWYTEFSIIVCNKLRKFINDDVKIIIMPYEGQPFQNTIFKKSKEINNSIKTIGYIHAFPLALPSYLIFRDGSPDEIIVNGDDQYACFINHLDWNSSCLKILPSTRFVKKKSENMAGFIYLPYDINSVSKIIESLENFIVNNNKKSISNLVVRNHPFKKNSKKHLQAIKSINALLAKYDNSFSKEHDMNNISISIFIGGSSSIIEALERGVEVIHICEDPVFQSYSNVLWPSIKVTEVNNNIFKYQLLKKGNLIKFGDNGKLFKEFYLN